MSQINQFSTSQSDEVETVQILNTAEPLVSEFERLLASEMHLLQTGRAEGMQAIAEAKQVLIEKLSGIEPELVELFVSQAHVPEIQNLKTRLLQCRTDNRNNHSLVMLELKHTNKSLELLRSVLKMDDLELYSQRGEVDVKREKRKLGNA